MRPASANARVTKPRQARAVVFGRDRSGLVLVLVPALVFRRSSYRLR